MHKFNQNPATPKLIHKLPAGIMPTDASIEFFGDRATKKVFFMHRGQTYPIRELGARTRAKLLAQLMADPIARRDLGHLPQSEAIERYAFCLYGTLDHTPDVTHTGMLNGSDNFICGIESCNCLNWKSKQISYDGQVIKGRLLQVLLAYRKGKDDVNVAAELNIAAPTLNSHKKKLFEIFNVYNSKELIIAAIEAKIIQ